MADPLSPISALHVAIVSDVEAHDVSPLTPIMTGWTDYDDARPDISPLSYPKDTDSHHSTGRSDSVLNSPITDEAPPSHSPVLTQLRLESRTLRRKRSFLCTDRLSESASSIEQDMPEVDNPPSIVPSHASCNTSTTSEHSHMPSSSLASTTTAPSSLAATASPDDWQHDESDSPLEKDLSMTEPLRTKRKFPSYKHAKRLPRWDAIGKLPHWGSADGGMWEVYAAVIEPGSRYEVAPRSSDGFPREKLEWDGLRPAALNIQRPLQPRKSRDDHTQRRELTWGMSGDTRSIQDEKADALAEEGPSSALSLFDFQFPTSHVMTGDEDSFAEPQDQVAPATPSSSHSYLAPTPSPATVHYRGASFDVVNPHASLLLGNHNFETPAEIDGFLDDYFDRSKIDDDRAQMASIHEKVSQLSLRSNGDNPRPRVLYDDALDARRKILGTHNEWAETARVVQYGPPSGRPSPVYIERTSPGLKSLPFRRQTSAPQVDPFADRSDGHAERLESEDSLLSIEYARSHRTPQLSQHRDIASDSADCECSSAQQVLASAKRDAVASRSQICYVARGRQPRLSEKSEPFDLYISDDGESIRHHKIDGIVDAQMDSHVNGSKRSLQPAAVTTPKQRSRAPSLYSEIETDPTMREIIDGYDYTRSIPLTSFANGGPASDESSPKDSVRGYDVYDRSPLPTVTVNHWSSKIDDAHYLHPGPLTPHAALPATPAPVYGGRYHRQLRMPSDSHVPTSERTYGETNQLLQITPVGDDASPVFTDAAVREPPKHEDSYDHRALHSAETMLSSNHHAKINDRPEPARNMQSFSKFRLHTNHRRQTSSICQNDDDSAWETQISESEPDMSALHRLSFDSAAGSGIGDSRVHLPTIPASPEVLMFPDIQHSDDVRQSSSAHRLTFFDGNRDSPVAHQLTRSQQDLQDAIRYIRGQLVVVDVVSATEKETRCIEAQHLEEIRRRNPQAVRQATDYIFRQRPGAGTRPNVLSGEAGNAPTTPSRVADRLRRVRILTPSSDQRHLLSSPRTADSTTPRMEGALVYSETANTFKTLRNNSPPPLPPIDHPVSRWSPATESADWPLGPHPVSPSARLSRLRSYEAMPAMTAQMSPQFAGRPNTPHGGLTDSGFIDRRNAWHALPPGGTRSPSIHDPIGAWRPRIGALTPTSARTLIRDRCWDGADDALARRAHRLSRAHLRLTALCPLASLAYGLGLLDHIMARRTSGRFAEMAPEHKRVALTRNLLIGTVAWLCLGCVVGVVIWVCLARKG